MPQPYGFSWIEQPLLGAMARPESMDDLLWLRSQGVQLLITLTEDSLPRHWVNDAGLFNMHVPIIDMHPPSQSQIELCMSAIEKARRGKFGAVLHCAAGLGRTGTLAACFLVASGLSAGDAIARIRDLRPGSVETDEQVEAVHQFAGRRNA